jgi:predicted RNase H-like HicB family nuclease
MQTYTAIYEQDPETGWYIASVEELPATISEGKTLEEAREMLRDAIALVLEDIHESASLHSA